MKEMPLIVATLYAITWRAMSRRSEYSDEIVACLISLLGSLKSLPRIIFDIFERVVFGKNMVIEEVNC